MFVMGTIQRIGELICGRAVKILAWILDAEAGQALAIILARTGLTLRFWLHADEIFQAGSESYLRECRVQIWSLFEPNKLRRVLSCSIRRGALAIQG